MIMNNANKYDITNEIIFVPKFFAGSIISLIHNAKKAVKTKNKLITINKFTYFIYNSI